MAYGQRLDIDHDFYGNLIRHHSTSSHPFCTEIFSIQSNIFLGVTDHCGHLRTRSCVENRAELWRA